MSPAEFESRFAVAPAPSRRPLADHWPIAASLLVHWGILAALLDAVLRRTGGRLIYALDDAYIHMAMAKNFAADGVWGISPLRFANASSSPLWTALLALIYRVTGANDVAPFVLNFIFSSALLVLIDSALRRRTTSTGFRFGTLLLVTLWTPLASLSFTGQEHTLHALLSVGYIHLLTRGAGRRIGRFLLLTALLALTRYEGLFLIGAGAAFLLIERRTRTAVLSLASGLFPILTLGIVSVAKGWWFLPNSVLLKGNSLRLGSPGAPLDFMRAAYRQALEGPEILFLLLAAAALFVYCWNREDVRGDRFTPALAIFAGATLLHLQFARLRWFYRYEAYLIVLGLFVIATVIAPLLARNPRVWRPSRRLLPAQAAVLLLCFFPFSALSNRTTDALPRVPDAAGNIYDQQFQVGLFLRAYYPSAAIAANDVGVVSFLAGVDCLDLWGLASREVAESRKNGTYDRDAIDRLTREHGCRIAVVYDSWFVPGGYAGIPAGSPGGLPARWICTGRWSIEQQVVVGDRTVSFYAADSTEAVSLAAHLKEFAPRLPGSVHPSGPGRRDR